MNETEMVADGWTLVGRIGVDTATVYIGDPVHGLPNDWLDSLYVEHPHDPPTNWGSAGVSVQTGFGDGVYPVYADIDEETGRVTSVLIDFFDDDWMDHLSEGLKKRNESM